MRKQPATRKTPVKRQDKPQNNMTAALARVINAGDRLRLFDSIGRFISSGFLPRRSL